VRIDGKAYKQKVLVARSVRFNSVENQMMPAANLTVYQVARSIVLRVAQVVAVQCLWPLQALAAVFYSLVSLVERVDGSQSLYACYATGYLVRARSGSPRRQFAQHSCSCCPGRNRRALLVSRTEINIRCTHILLMRKMGMLRLLNLSKDTNMNEEGVRSFSHTEHL